MRAKGALLALWLGTSAATGETAGIWNSVGDWDIAIDSTIDNGCYALASWASGTLVRIGLNPQRDNYYFLLGNRNWASLVPEKEYEIRIQFDNRPFWEVTTLGLRLGEDAPVYLHAQSDQADFIEEFQAALRMRISYNGRAIDTLQLRGSQRAWREVERCQEKVNAQLAAGKAIEALLTETGAGSEDPFAE